MRAVRTVVALSVASSLLLMSCAPTAPDQGLVQPGATLPVVSVAVVAEAAIARDDTDPGYYYVVEESRQVSSWMIESATRIMERGRYRVDFSLVPFVGGFLGEDEVLDVAPKRGGLKQEQSPPFFVSPAVSNDAGYRDALVAVLKQVASTDVQGKGPLVTYAHSASPARPDWNLLSERMGTDHLLVAVAGGVTVSGWKQTGEGCFSSCLSMAFTVLLNAICSSVTGGDMADVDLEDPAFGEVTIDIETQSHLISVVQLFNVRTGDVVWTSTMGYGDIDPLSQSFYTAKWGPDLLQGFVHLPLPRRR